MANDPGKFDWTQVNTHGGRPPLDLTGGVAPASRSVPLRTPAPDAPGAPGGNGGGSGGHDGNGGGFETGGPSNVPALIRPNPWKWVVRGLALLILLFVLTIGWLAVTAPLSKSLQPPAPPSITLLAADGTPIARRGATIGAPVDAEKLPPYVRDAFVSIEDRRFYDHWGVDPRGILRAMWTNVSAGQLRQGGSTITQQLAKNAFLDSSRTAGRKFQEVLIAFWLEAWLSKDEILSRYLSNVYFGDNVYGLTAAARHYFSTTPERLTVAQAAMLAGLVKAPSRLAPTGNLEGARERQAVVIQAMVDAGALTPAEASAVRPAVLHPARENPLPNGTYFADWVLPQARDRQGEIASEQTVRTTLDTRFQRLAERAIARAGLNQAQAALVAMRPDGSVVAMVGGRDYAASPFNRATQARRQAGSTFKLFVYLAALRSGLTPDSMIEDEPVTIGDWSPSNSDGRYRGEITLREAFARSSNVAAARLIQRVGARQVIRAARDLGISTPIPDELTIALGTSNVSLLEMTAAYAAVAAGKTPVAATGLPPEEDRGGWLGGGNRQTAISSRELSGLRDLLSASVNGGTSRAASLPLQAYGKTGTTQDSRDAWFIGYAGDLVVGVWIGNDDNSPNPGLTSRIPARIWHDFMSDALNLTQRAAPVTQEPVIDNAVDETGGNDTGIGPGTLDIQGDFMGRGFGVRVDGQNGLQVTTPPAPGTPPADKTQSGDNNRAPGNTPRNDGTPPSTRQRAPGDTGG